MIVFFCFGWKSVEFKLLLIWVPHFTVGVHWQQYPPVLNIFSSCYISNIAGMGSIHTPRINFKPRRSKNNSYNCYTSTACRFSCFRYQTLVCWRNGFPYHIYYIFHLCPQLWHTFIGLPEPRNPVRSE